MEKVVKFSERALDFIRSSVQEEKCQGIRVDIIPGGCSGMTYKIDFVNEADSADLIVEEAGVKVFIAPKAVLFINGMTLDYLKTPMGGNLVFQNPNARSKCSCGKSFSVDSSPCKGDSCCS